MLAYLSAVCCVLVAQVFSQSMNEYELEKRFHYPSMPIMRYILDGKNMRENLRRLHDELRQKRFEGINEYMNLEDPNSKRTSLKRLAILSARGFGKK
ncbi:hypothetical protein DICVIV_06938 [Dictyocaulus viviparus]|uniref:Uncharacterized protein n=1 Tax=Dictyocaulus viviparus TaxID=29172 RepID=A0A0D8XQR2_DICVI|nr:hypothetical protein DICVIV_06938 [Dictyocaulus viviparus]